MISLIAVFLCVKMLYVTDREMLEGQPRRGERSKSMEASGCPPALFHMSYICILDSNICLQARIGLVIASTQARAAWAREEEPKH